LAGAVGAGDVGVDGAVDPVLGEDGAVVEPVEPVECSLCVVLLVVLTSPVRFPS
jgi:hypothetical protein